MMIDKSSVKEDSNCHGIGSKRTCNCNNKTSTSNHCSSSKATDKELRITEEETNSTSTFNENTRSKNNGKSNCDEFHHHHQIVEVVDSTTTPLLIMSTNSKQQQQISLRDNTSRSWQSKPSGDKETTATRQDEANSVEKLLKLFQTCDTTGYGVLARHELFQLCDCLQLDMRQTDYLISTLLEEGSSIYKAKVNFDNFKQAFIKTLLISQGSHHVQNLMQNRQQLSSTIGHNVVAGGPRGQLSSIIINNGQEEDFIIDDRNKSVESVSSSMDSSINTGSSSSGSATSYTTSSIDLISDNNNHHHHHHHHHQQHHQQHHRQHRNNMTLYSDNQTTNNSLSNLKLAPQTDRSFPSTNNSKQLATTRQGEEMKVLNQQLLYYDASSSPSSSSSSSSASSSSNEASSSVSPSLNGHSTRATTHNKVHINNNISNENQHLNDSAVGCNLDTAAAAAADGNQDDTLVVINCRDDDTQLTSYTTIRDNDYSQVVVDEDEAYDDDYTTNGDDDDEEEDDNDDDNNQDHDSRHRCHQSLVSCQDLDNHHYDRRCQTIYHLPGATLQPLAACTNNDINNCSKTTIVNEIPSSNNDDTSIEHQQQQVSNSQACHGSSSIAADVNDLSLLAKLTRATSNRQQQQLTIANERPLKSQDTCCSTVSSDVDQQQQQQKHSDGYVREYSHHHHHHCLAADLPTASKSSSYNNNNNNNNNNPSSRDSASVVLQQQQQQQHQVDNHCSFDHYTTTTTTTTDAIVVAILDKPSDDDHDHDHDDDATKLDCADSGGGGGVIVVVKNNFTMSNEKEESPPLSPSSSPSTSSHIIDSTDPTDILEISTSSSLHLVVTASNENEASQTTASILLRQFNAAGGGESARKSPEEHDEMSTESTNQNHLIQHSTNNGCEQAELASSSDFEVEASSFSSSSNFKQQNAEHLHDLLFVQKKQEVNNTEVPAVFNKPQDDKFGKVSQSNSDNAQLQLDCQQQICQDSNKSQQNNTLAVVCPPTQSSDDRQSIIPSPMDHDGCSTVVVKEPLFGTRDTTTLADIGQSSDYIVDNTPNLMSSSDYHCQIDGNNEMEMPLMEQLQEKEEPDTIGDPSSAENYLRSIWQTLNVGLDGYLNIDELYLVCQYIGMCELNNDMIQQLFNTLDTDQDGRVGFDEFTQGLFKQQQQMQQQQQQQMQQPLPESSQECSSDDDEQYYLAQSSSHHYCASGNYNQNGTTATSNKMVVTENNLDTSSGIVTSSTAFTSSQESERHHADLNLDTSNTNKTNTLLTSRSNYDSSYYILADSNQAPVAINSNNNNTRDKSSSGGFSGNFQVASTKFSKLNNTTDNCPNSNVIHEEENEENDIVVDGNNVVEPVLETTNCFLEANFDCARSKHNNYCNGESSSYKDLTNNRLSNNVGSSSSLQLLSSSSSSSSSNIQTKRQSSSQDNDNYEFDNRRSNKHHHSSSFNDNDADRQQQQQQLDNSILSSEHDSTGHLHNSDCAYPDRNVSIANCLATTMQNSSSGQGSRQRRTTFGPTARAQRRHTLGMGIFGSGSPSTTVWSMMSTNSGDDNQPMNSQVAASSFDRHKSNQSLERLFDVDHQVATNNNSNDKDKSTIFKSANREQTNNKMQTNDCSDSTTIVIDSNIMASPMRVPRMSQRISYSTNDISHMSSTSTRQTHYIEEEDNANIFKIRNNINRNTSAHLCDTNSNDMSTNSRNGRTMSSATPNVDNQSTLVNPMIQFFRLDPNKRGFVNSSDLISYWESLGFYNAGPVLKQLGYDSSYNRAINIENLSSRLEDELQIVSTQSRSETFQLAMASLLQELTDLRVDHDQLAEERDKLRENVTEANSRAAILANEIDEHHAKLEQASMNKIMQLEKKNQEQLRLMESQFVKEREQMNSHSIKLQNEVTNELISAQAQEIKSRQIISQLEHERNTMQMKLDDIIKLNHELKQQLHISELNQRKLEEMESSHNSVLESQQRSMSDQLDFLDQVNKKLRDENDELITELTHKDQQIQRLSSIIDSQKTPPESLKMETGHSIDHAIQVKQQQPPFSNHQPLNARNNLENRNNTIVCGNTNRGAVGLENSNHVTNPAVGNSQQNTATLNNNPTTSATSSTSTTKKQSNSRFKQRRNEHRGGRQGYRQRPS